MDTRPNGLADVYTDHRGLPFAAEYAAERMQAWLMLAFGESVIALLIEPIYYEKGGLEAVTFSFIMILLVAAAWFDITDADQFLELFLLQGQKFRAFMYMLLQGPFSFCVWLVGVALKSVLFVYHEERDLEVESGCETNQEAFRRGRRLAGWDLEELDYNLPKFFRLLSTSLSLVIGTCIIVAFAIPSPLSWRRVVPSRVLAVVTVLMINTVNPSNRGSLLFDLSLLLVSVLLFLSLFSLLWSIAHCEYLTCYVCLSLNYCP